MRLLLTLFAVVIVVPGALWLFQRRLIYLPVEQLPSVADVAGTWREVTLSTTDGLALAAWYSPPQPGRPIVIVFNGNAGNRAGRLPLGNALAERGMGVLLTDYRGYGGNPGHPSASGLARDSRAALRWVREHAAGHPVVYFGESLGSGVAVELASEEAPDALVLRSPFVSLAAVGKVHYPFLPVRLMLRDDFPSLERIRHVVVPTLVVAGTEDSIVPPEQSREIYEAAAGPKRWLSLEGAGHNDARFADGSEMIEAITAFLVEHGL